MTTFHSALPLPVADGLSLPVVQARDRRQVEVKQAYALPAPGQTHNYQLDVFLFVPRAMGISVHTYPKSDFYSDATVYLRLDAPGRSLRELADLDDERSPLAQVHATLPKLLHPQAPSTDSLATLAQLHAHELSEAFIATFSALGRVAGEGNDCTCDELLVQVNALLDDAQRALVAMRQVRAETDAFGALVHPTFARALRFAEEYASAVLDEQVALLSQAVRDSPWLRDGQGTAVRALLMLSQFALEESRLRMESGYALPSDEPSEYFTYRLSLLKKNLQQALYLNTRELRGDNYVRNTAAMVGAGLAATWAFLSQVPMQLGPVGAGAQLGLAASFIGAYMLKDRIKEWTREYLVRRWRIDDYSRSIVADALARFGLTELSGKARERMRFLNLDEVDPEVRDVRAVHRSVMGTGLELEEVIHYRRRLTLNADEKARIAAGFGVREILRLNTRALIQKLDDPLDDVSYFDAAAGRFMRGSLPKVYHANLVLRISAQHLPTRWLVRSRLVLNQDGLVRVEPVLTRSVSGKMLDD